ncbi:MAG: putative Cleavage and polyadenylation specificity factor subunit 4 [Streblomastix strix]|uniref:Putative Cleavage and polyadenylation specificity factor subunit 4 n=1 Tax=Streblomastix strix TaxID=222440 RepID=A0A5J4WPC7_9EUKA|nr:MAG: putative Cleavage and polyadenylation specificity factor subunit 4 [Streblomastix strix]
MEAETDLEREVRRKLFNDQGMSRSEERCTFYLAGHCPRGQRCPYKHIKPKNNVVCKHWFRGLCKQGNNCDFLHLLDMQLMPECQYFASNGICTKEDCAFRHVTPEDKIHECVWYNRGFCSHGPKCKSKHARKQPCPLYMAGFCPDGPNCINSHLRFELGQQKDEDQQRQERMMETQRYIGATGGQSGSSSSYQSYGHANPHGTQRQNAPLYNRPMNPQQYKTQQHPHYN